MSLEACYAAVEGDLEGTRARLMSDDRIRKFLPMLAKDPSFHALEKALAAHDTEGAFRSAHTLKGTARDLGFVRLASLAEKMQEATRAPSDWDEAESLMPRLVDEYEATVDAISIA